MKKLIAGNWKMNGTLASARDLAGAVRTAVEGDPALRTACDFVVCPPALQIAAARDILRDGPVALGAQDSAMTADGAFTGNLSAAMIRDAGCTYVILGHSERRQHHEESDADVAAKARLAHAENLITIICVGETEDERAGGDQEAVVGRQLQAAIPDGATAFNTVIAYEPVWAIGTGKNATPDDVGSMHAFIRVRLKDRFTDSASIHILYGGSVKPDNAGALFNVENVDGALIGGASLKADHFIAIAKAVR